jgi:hypothetical protein
VEADHDNGVEAGGHRFIQEGLGSVVCDALHDFENAPSIDFSLFGEGHEIRLLDVIQEATNTLVHLVRIRKAFEFRIERPQLFKDRRKSIVDDR